MQVHGVIVGLGVGVPLIVAVAVEVAVALAVAVVVLVAVAVALAVGVALTVAVAVAVGVGSGDTSAPATAGNISSARMRMPVATLIPRFLSNSDIGLETFAAGAPGGSCSSSSAFSRKVRFGQLPVGVCAFRASQSDFREAAHTAVRQFSTD